MKSWREELPGAFGRVAFEYGEGDVRREGPASIVYRMQDAEQRFALPAFAALNDHLALPLVVSCASPQSLKCSHGFLIK